MIGKAPAPPTSETTSQPEISPNGSASSSVLSRWAAGLVLAGYVAWLVHHPSTGVASHAGPALKLSDLQDSARLTAWTTDVTLIALAEVVLFLPVGLLLPLVWGRRVSRCGRVVQWLASVLLAFGLAAAERWLEIGRTPQAAQLILPAIGCLLGVGIGIACLRGFAAVLWLLPKAALLLFLLVSAGVWLVGRCLDTTPLPFQTPQVTSAEKRRVVNLIQRSPREREDGIVSRHVRLSEADIDFLLAWANSLGLPERKSQIRFGDDHLQASASVRLSLPRLGPRYVNLQTAGRLQVIGDALRLRIERLRVGRVDLPRWLLRSLSPRLESFVEADPDIRTALDSIQSIEIEPSVASFVYDVKGFNRSVLPLLVNDVDIERDVLSATQAQVRHLVAAADTLPEGEARFGEFLQSAFALARKRSLNSEAVVENRAAIYALGILLGHRHVERFIGPVLDEELRRAARRKLGHVTIRRRGDWTRHFFVSAALASLSSETVSDAVGLLKEELDAGKGGSGFSFADLLADRAGTLFALAAVRDEASAKAMQRRLAGEFNIDEFFPPAADLPEGLSDAELELRYGGVGGEGYQRLVDEIERRLATCAALR